MSRRRNQGGFTLLVVLVVLGFFSLILVALLGLVSNDARTTANFADLARDRRAADSALQVGMTRLKTASAATLGQSGACAGVSGSDVSINSKVVRVRCDQIPAAVPSRRSPR